MTRIIAGAAKGRRLAVPPAGTRPTSDRAREGLFNSLATMLDLDGARVLDLFAGSGAVGLEALSRGAATAVLVESNRRAVEVLRRNVATVGLGGARIEAVAVAKYPAEYLAEYLSREPGDRFDLVFADPPYAEAATVLPATASALEPWLADEAVIVLEAPVGVAAPELSCITWTGEKRYGETRFWYGRRR